MNRQDFETIFFSRVEKTKELLITKAASYASDHDRMHNFKRASAISGEHPCKALNGFLLKHITSYFDILDRIEKGELIKHELLDEKLGDIITYFFLQEALMYDTCSVDLTGLK